MSVTTFEILVSVSLSLFEDAGFVHPQLDITMKKDDSIPPAAELGFDDQCGSIDVVIRMKSDSGGENDEDG